jgi:hypothetical protein
VSAVGAAIYTPVGVGLNILLLFLIKYCKNEDIKNYKM